MSKRILYSVLDWGLGHATRSVPVIKSLLDRDCDVTLASDSKALQLLRSEFPYLEYHELKAYNVEYASQSLIVNVVRNSRRIYKAMTLEQKQTAEIARAEGSHAIVTDNRYGSYVKDLPSVIITHQLQFRTGSGLADNIAASRVRRWLRPFDLIWIPDDPEHTLSGELSMTNDKRKRYIGWLSTVKPVKGSRVYDLAAIISGPEPQRTNLEKRVLEQLGKLPLKSIVVRGLPGNSALVQQGNVTVVDFASRDFVNQLIAQSGVILCRSGYSSLMDLQSVGKRAILTPTPGQPEQVYLADRMAKLSQFVVQDQDHLDIPAALATLQQREAPRPDTIQQPLLDRAIDELLRL